MDSEPVSPTDSQKEFFSQTVSSPPRYDDDYEAEDGAFCNDDEDYVPGEEGDQFELGDGLYDDQGSEISLEQYMNFEQSHFRYVEESSVLEYSESHGQGMVETDPNLKNALAAKDWRKQTLPAQEVQEEDPGATLRELPPAPLGLTGGVDSTDDEGSDGDLAEAGADILGIYGAGGSSLPSSDDEDATQVPVRRGSREVGKGPPKQEGSDLRQPSKIPRRKPPELPARRMDSMESASVEGSPLPGDGPGNKKKKKKKKRRDSQSDQTEDKMQRGGPSAIERHKLWLEKMQAQKNEKKKAEELAEMKKQRYRQKVKEGLLQRAGVRAGEEGFTRLTKAAQSGMVKKEEEEELTPEEKAKREKEHHDKVAATRRQFKEKQKRHMKEIIEKRKAEQAQQQIEAEKEEKRKKKLHAQAMKRLKEEREQHKAKLIANLPENQRHAKEGGEESVSASPQSIPRGSGVAAVRAKQTEEGAELDPEAQKKELLAKKKARKEAKQRQERELKRIAEERKKKEEAEIAMQKRLEKRAQLLREKTLEKISAEKEKRIVEAGENIPENTSAEDNKEEQPEKKQLTAEQQQAMVNRLTAKKDAAVPTDAEFRDYSDWKKKNGLKDGQRVFCMTGWYPCVKEALLERGWFFNPDRDSRFFDLKWTLRSSDIRKEQLEPQQLTNHFLKNIAITTKVGLLRNLRHLSHFVNVDSDDIYPRGYDLSSDLDMLNYMDDYRSVAAEMLLKNLLLRVGGEPALRALSGSVIDVYELDSDGESIMLNDSSSDEETEGSEDTQKPEAPSSENTGSANQESQPEGKNDASETEELKQGKEGESLSKDTDNMAPEPTMEAQPKKESEEKEQPKKAIDFVDLDLCDELLINAAVFQACLDVCRKRVTVVDDSYIDAPGRALEPLITDLQWELVSSGNLYEKLTLPDNPPEPLDAFLKEEEKIDPNDWKAKKKASRKRKALQASRKVATHDATLLKPLGEEGIIEVIRALESLKAGCPQFEMNGVAEAKNVWIVKPAAKSRGRGIQTFNNIERLLEYVEARDRNTACQWVVQKYMENPLIIAKRKFDIRQWVLVTDWNPLTIWFNQGCYLRFGVEEYTLDNESMENKFIHLVNNSIGKYSDQYHQKLVAEDGKEIFSCMWSSDDFKEYLTTMKGEDLFTKTMQPRMKQIAKWSLMAVQDLIEHRKNSWELYGYDYMIDENYQPYLIEINSSPACDYSTYVTEVYVKQALADLVKVTIDLRDWEATKKSQRSPEPPDTGSWELIHKSGYVQNPLTSMGTEIILTGTKIEKKKK